MKRTASNLLGHLLKSEILRGSRQFSFSRPHPSSTEPSKLANTSIYVSDSHNPFFNLAFEDWIFRKTDPSQIVLFMYRNTPSVIIGRNQNPWKEINLLKLKSLGIPFVRRKSGGGTVYHDLGNTNYCVFLPRTRFERKTNAEMVARALQRLDVPAYVNDRNDICVDSFKVSGSAFKLVNSRAYHHGTMLLDARLGDLRGVLGNSKSSMVTKGVASVPSPVKNIREWSEEITHDLFVKAVADEFVNDYGGQLNLNLVDESELETNSYVQTVEAELRSWDWMYGQTPEFSHDITVRTPAGPMVFVIKSRHARITSAELGTAVLEPSWRRAAEGLIRMLAGDRYGSLDDTRSRVEDILSESDRDRISTLVRLLQTEM
ncbi:Lipoyltransferase and lipoate-protein ligase [Meredithblackwellia eburnea MCA 4105]